MKRKISVLFLILVSLFIFTGCGKGKHIDGELTDIMAKVYKVIPEEERPMMLENVPVNKENVARFLGTDKITFKEALASESGIGSFAHSVVLVRANENQDVEQLKKDIKENVDPRKWICVSVEEENVVVDNIGDLVILIMDNDYSTKLHDSFKKLK